MSKINEEELIRDFLRKARSMSFNSIKEDINDNNQNQDISGNKQQVVIDKNDENFIELVNNINNFVGAVRYDANAMVVYPSDNDVVFNGMITDMNNLKFQFRYNDQSGGLYIWADSMLLNKETSEKLSKLVSIREQWKDYWSQNISQYSNQK